MNQQQNQKCNYPIMHPFKRKWIYLMLLLLLGLLVMAYYILSFHRENQYQSSKRITWQMQVFNNFFLKELEDENVIVGLEARKWMIPKNFADSSEQACQKDMVQERTLDLTKGDAEAFQELRRDQLIAYQETRQITSTLETMVIPEELLSVFRKVLAESSRYGYLLDREVFSDYASSQPSLEIEQVKEYLGDAYSDNYEWGILSSAYQIDWEQNGRDVLLLFFESDATGGGAAIDIWQKQADGTTKRLYSISELRGFGTLLEYKGIYYFVVRKYNFNNRETEGFDILTIGAGRDIHLYQLSMKNKENQAQWIETYANKSMDAYFKQKITDYLETKKKEIVSKSVPINLWQY